MNRADTERFHSKIAAGKPDECWLWTGGCFNTGYGAFKLDGQNRGAHRVAWALSRKPNTGGPDVLHRCDNRKCVNPAHLFRGTRGENNSDRHAKGRDARGITNGMARLTEAMVLDIRRRHAQGGVSQHALARAYNVSQRAVWSILHRETWSHVA